MPTLFQWDLILRRGVPVGVGIVSGHRKLEEGIDIHTSPVLHAARIKNALQMETASGSVYLLRMSEWSPRVGGAEPLRPELLGLPSDFWERCAQAREEASKAEQAELRPLMEPGTLFMRIVGAHVRSALWAGPDAQIRDATIGIHLGMFQDSYLIRGEYEESAASHYLDFRLFPMGNRLEPYHISRGLKLLQIRNEGLTDIAFGFSSKNIVCLSGTVTSIPVQGLPEFILADES